MAVSLIEPCELQTLLSRRTTMEPVVVIDARPRLQFNTGHISRAVSMNWEDWCELAPPELGPTLQQPGYWGILTDAGGCGISSLFCRAGIGNDVTVVVYADGAASKGREGRIAWMLAYWGVRDVRLLNGGMSAWISAGLPVEKSAVMSLAPVVPHMVASAAEFEINLQHERRMQLSHLQDLGQNGRMPVMLDTRSQNEFAGYDYRYMPRMGCVPDSLLIEHADIFHANGQYLPRDQFLKKLPAAVVNSDSVVTYCEVGVRACNVALLFEIYTGRIMPVYDGSMMEWGAHPDLPVHSLSA